MPVTPCSLTSWKTEGTMYTIIKAFGDRTQFFILGEETILDLKNLMKDGFNYLSAVPPSIPTQTCPDCGSEIVEITEDNRDYYCSGEEPDSRAYTCGRVVLAAFGTAEFRACPKKQ